MKVTLLGTSSAEGWPALFCGCDACGNARKLGGKNIRTRCSAIIDDRLKIDFPPDILTQVVQNRLDLRCLSAILFTHAHEDHCAISELQYRGRYFVPRPFAECLSLYGPQDVISAIQTRFSHDGAAPDREMYPFRLVPMTSNTTTTVSDYQVTPLVANHDPKQECFNYIIQDEAGASLLYATDTGWYKPATLEQLKRFKLNGVVIEATKGMQVGGYEGHLSFPEVITLRKLLIEEGILPDGAPFVTTHVSHLCGMMHDEMVDLLAPHGITAGYDGMSFNIYAPDL